ncbi:MAG: dihydrolipoyllysine-residue succinyltransferase [Chlamydiota bacterium]|jgi:2-oxoglutarate dehydrogenase E2 component (dihydrolipoamide succinyltransferase)
MKKEVKVPSLGESITEATVSNILKTSGSYVDMDEEIIELETDKVNQTINAPESGVLTVNVKVDDVVKVGQVLGEIDTEAKGPKKEEQPKEEKPKEKPEKKVQTGTKIRETEEDFLQSIDIEQKEEAKEEKLVEPKKESKNEKRTRMSKLRRVISQKLVEAKNQTAMLTTFNEVDMKEIIDFRKNEQESFQKKHGVKLGFMSFFIKAVVKALEQYPEINGYIDGEEIVIRNYYNIGVAVGTEKGLMVPVINDCDKKSFAELEKELKVFAEKAREGSLSIDSLQGGGFTISNGGVYGSMLSTPILNPPQSGILGMHAIQKRAVVIEDEIVIRPMMYLALSYDHRIVDGKEAIGFLVQMKNYLEDPIRQLVDS